MYHGVSWQRGRRFRRFVVSPEAFEQQMDHLHANGFRVCSVSELVRMRSHGPRDETKKLVGLTFDDAFAELEVHAVPVLARLGFAATVYVPTAYIGASSRWLERAGEGDRPVLSVRQLRRLADDGIECGAHGHMHVPLDVASVDAARREIELSKRVLEEIIERDVRSFAYPFGYDSGRVRAIVAHAGYESACRVNYSPSPSCEDVYALSRLPVDGDYTVERFASLVDGHNSLRSRRIVANAWRPVRRARAKVKGPRSTHRR